MARPRKGDTARDTRAELIAAARRLFLTTGYSGAFVNAVIAATGLSKGTFYHHFGSAAGLLEAVVDEMVDEAWRLPKQALQDQSVDALVRINRFLHRVREGRMRLLPKAAHLARALYARENSLLRERLRAKTVELVSPVLADCLRQGAAAGLLRVERPEAAARVFLLITTAATDDMMAELSAAAGDRSTGEVFALLADRLRVVVTGLEAIIGAAEGALEPPNEEVLRWIVVEFAS